MLVIGLQSTVPQGAGAKIVKALAADLKINAAIGFQNALVSKWPDKSHFATVADLGRTNHHGTPIIETLVQNASHSIRKNMYEVHAASEVEQCAPSGSSTNTKP